MDIGYEQIKPYIEKGLIREQIHPENPNVRIFNYTQECNFSGAWDDITMQCRGLILNIATGEVLALPFKKFFNYEELLNKGQQIPNEEYTVWEKLDGSLGILYYMDGVPWIATRGSFTSEQALWATEWYRKNCTSVIGQFFSKLDTEMKWTHLFEIIYPQNRIVVSYDFEGLTYLGSVRKENAIVKKFVVFNERLRDVECIGCDDYTTLKAQNESNKEGYVIRFSSGFMMKIKFDDYVRLHRLLTGTTARTVWEIMRDGEDIEKYKAQVPEEFSQWIDMTWKKIKAEYDAIDIAARQTYEYVYAGNSTLDTVENKRKIFAEQAKKTDYPSLMFMLLDGQQERVRDHIYKLIKPAAEKPFRLQSEDSN